MTQQNIIVRGARVHNLKNIDVTIPRDKFVVITGLSGSGKSSLAFDTIYAEGQRRYVESLSAYARQFLGQMDKPDVDSIEGLSPAISIDQKSTSKNPRSTVGTITEIYDYVRLLFARVGKARCPVHGTQIESQSVDQMIDKILELPTGTKIQILAPVVVERKGKHSALLASIRKDGYTRLRINGEIVELDDSLQELDPKKKHSIEIVIDRILVKSDIQSRLADSLELALKSSGGELIIDVTHGEEMRFSQNLACPKCGFVIGKITPQLFSFNSPLGACETCGGLGYHQELDADLLVTDPELPICGGAIDIDFALGSYYSSYEILRSVCKHFNISMEKPFDDLAESEKELILYGPPDSTEFVLQYNDDHGRKREVHAFYSGLVEILRSRYESKRLPEYVRQKIEGYMSLKSCPTCKGARLKTEALNIFVDKFSINQLTHLSIIELQKSLQKLKLNKVDKQIAQQIMKELHDRIGFLVDVGLGYLTLARNASTLSGGEAQRIRLATQIGSCLTGVLYVLDEPSIGLHQRDNERLLASLLKIRDLGNSLLVVEHDEETIFAADYVLDIGPGAGLHGGEVVAAGTPQELIEDYQESASLTAAYLSGSKFIPIPDKRYHAGDKWLTIHGASENNLKSVDVNIPVGLFTCVTGVSGSGKSTLVNHILLKSLQRKLTRARVKPGAYQFISGTENFDKVIDVDQSPIGRTPRSNPVTYIGVFDDVRDLFARTTEARMRGYAKGRFSFNVSGGRCEHCKGDGTIKIEMHFLPDVYIVCAECKGKRYNRETLEIKYKGKSISDILGLTVEEAVRFFKHIPKIARKLQTLDEVGLSYMRLGQSATTLSGGEAQRIKLASELHKRSSGRTIYILDEPTTGLHVDDIARLIKILHCFVEGGNTVVVIEHNLDVIKTADHIIDLGPEGGNEGGKVIATGTPEQVALNPESYTGRFLAPILQRDSQRKLQRLC